jgi:transposase-like protein
MSRHYTYESGVGPRCPYCDHQHNADEPAYYNEDNSPFECEHCSKPFQMEVYTSTSWTCTVLEDEDAA